MSRDQAQRNEGVLGWFARNSIAANVLMVTFIAGGWWTMSRTNSDLFPDIDPRTITVEVRYPGASPDEIENSVTKRAEEAVLGLEGIERVRSKAREGSATVTIGLTDFADAQTLAQEVQSALDSLAAFPPEGAEDPEVSVTAIVSNVIRLVITGDVGELALRRAAEDLERELLSLDDVSSVTLQGARKYEISIEVSRTALREYNLSLGQIANAVRSSSVNSSGGTLRTSAGNILLRTGEEVEKAEDYENIVILKDVGGRSVLLGEVATIKDGFEDSPLINTYNGQPAVFLQVARSESEDSIQVAQVVRTFLKDYAPPAGISVTVAGDQTEVIQDRINLLLRNAIMGLALVFVFLALTLDLRLAFWTCVGIPIAFFGGFILFGQFTTINMTMLLGLIMVLGLVVDDAIVVGESIYDEQENRDPDANSAIKGVARVAAPVVVGVMTTCAVFAPLLFSSGMLGQLLRPVPIVAIAVLVISLIEVFFILPSHMAHGGDWSTGPMKRLKDSVQNGLNLVRDRCVMPVVRLSLEMPFLVVTASIALLIATMGLVTGGHIRFVFFPMVEGEEIKVTLEMPQGTSFAQTEKAMRHIMESADQMHAQAGGTIFRGSSVTIGGELMSGFGSEGTRTSSEIATATMELTPAGERDLTASQIERGWREAIGEIPGVRRLAFVSEGLSSGADISFSLSHRDEERLTAAVAQLLQDLRRIDGVAEVESSAKPGSRQLEFKLTPEGHAAGLAATDLANQVRQSFFGEEVQRIQRGSEEVVVMVRLPENERRSLSDLIQMDIVLPNGDSAALTTVAQVIETRGFASIDRVDGRRIVTVSADVDEGVTTPNVVSALLAKEVIPKLLESHPGLRLTEDGQSRDQAEDLKVLMTNLVVGIMVMYVLLSSQLRSYLQPMIILFAIPFGAVGAVLGHWLLGYDLTFLSLFGMVALAGVVVNDSVVLIDYFNARMASGEGTAHEHIVAAVERRFRPILLTTMTTFLGLVPMVSETSVQAKFLIPMALSVAFGILFASILILVLVPACLAIITSRRSQQIETCPELIKG